MGIAEGDTKVVRATDDAKPQWSTVLEQLYLLCRTWSSVLLNGLDQVSYHTPQNNTKRMTANEIILIVTVSGIDIFSPSILIPDFLVLYSVQSYLDLRPGNVVEVGS